MRFFPLFFECSSLNLLCFWFFSGGGASMMASWTPTPGADLAPLSTDVLSNRIGCPCHDGLFFQAYSPESHGDAFDWTSLAAISDTVLDDVWNGWTPTVEHEEHDHDLWYSTDSAFVDEIAGFAATDEYVMRWRGQIHVAMDGVFDFMTRSDDGSMLYINGELIVDNDGLHGMQEQEGTVPLESGPHDIVITFYERSGGAGLQVRGARLLTLHPVFECCRDHLTVAHVLLHPPTGLLDLRRSRLADGPAFGGRRPADEQHRVPGARAAECGPEPPDSVAGQRRRH